MQFKIPLNPNLISAFSSRHNENMSLCYGDTANSLVNRISFLKNLGVDYRSLTCAGQVHGTNIKVIVEEDLGKGALSHDTAIADTDALITNHPNIPLAIFTADDIV